MIEICLKRVVHTHVTNVMAIVVMAQQHYGHVKDMDVRIVMEIGQRGETPKKPPHPHLELKLVQSIISKNIKV